MSSNKRTKADKPIVRSKDYRIIFVNGFRLRVSQNDVALTMVIEMENEQGQPIIQEEVRAMMTTRSLKVLMLLLQNVVADIENKAGPIELPPGKEAEIAASKVEKSIVKPAKI